MAVALLFVAGAAYADEESTRVIIAGPRTALEAKLEKEILGLGFTPIDSDVDCGREAVMAAAVRANAVAVLCSDGQKVDVWTNDPGKNALELRDTVSPTPGHDDVAMRAAEVMRANVEFREAEPPPPPPPKKAAPLQPEGEWDGFDKKEQPKAPEGERMTHTFTASLGTGILIGTDTASTVISGRVAYGVHRRFSLTARMDFPVSQSSLATSAQSQAFSGGAFEMQTGLVGGGLELPIFEPTSRVIPRFSVNGGAVWVHATRSPSGDFTDGSTATQLAAATWADAALSVGIVGPFRVVGEATFGSAFGRLTVIDDSFNPVGHFGTPFGALALRLELALQ